jgi:hypothetical protein
MMHLSAKVRLAELSIFQHLKIILKAGVRLAETDFPINGTTFLPEETLGFENVFYRNRL